MGRTLETRCWELAPVPTLPRPRPGPGAILRPAISLGPPQSFVPANKGKHRQLIVGWVIPLGCTVTLNSQLWPEAASAPYNVGSEGQPPECKVVDRVSAP